MGPRRTLAGCGGDAGARRRSEVCCCAFLALLALVGFIVSCGSFDSGERDPFARGAEAWLDATLAHAPAAARLVGAAEPFASEGRSVTIRSNGIEARIDRDHPDEMLLEPLDDARSVRVRRLDAAGVRLETTRRAVVLGAAGPGVDAIVFARGGVEELAVLEAPGATLAYGLDLPPGLGLRVARGGGSVEIVDREGVPWMRARAAHAWDAGGREVRVAWSLDGARMHLRVTDENAAWPVVVDPSWQTAANMSAVRDGQTSTLLPDGRVLVAGGIELPALFVTLDTAETYDPRTARFALTGSMATARYYHSATLLPNGKVLVVGGVIFTPPNNIAYVATAELWDPRTEAFTPAGSLPAGRAYHTASLLANGKVLIAGGANESGLTASALLYDPATNQFTPTGSLATKREHARAALLPDGRVLVSGGDSGATTLQSTELYDSSGNGGLGAFGAGPPMTVARARHSATLLRSGLVLIGGGENGSGALATNELFDPQAGTFTATGPMAGKRTRHMAALLPSGAVLLAGGQDGASFMTSAELYDPSTGACAGVGSMSVERDDANATMLATGSVLVVGGGINATAEIFDPLGGGGAGSTAPASPLGTARAGATVTPLPSGKVLVVGGTDASGSPVATAEIFDPGSGGGGAYAPTGPMSSARVHHAATLLASGKVLVTGGQSGFGATTASAELFDPSAAGGVGAFQGLASMTAPRAAHTTTLLASGHVLVAGGYTSGLTSLSSAELFDPATSGFTALPNLTTARSGHTATLLTNGAVLLVGGLQSTTAELYQPGPSGFGVFVATGLPSQPRVTHTATLLMSGKVLVAGGLDPTLPLTSCELYDPASGAFTAAPSLATPRAGHAALLVTSGKVLVAGGCSAFDCGTRAASMELYEPLAAAAGTFVPTSSLGEGRDRLGAALLTDGSVLLSGGATMTASATTATDRWVEGDGAASAWRAVVVSAPLTTPTGVPAAITGSAFIGSSEGSAGGTLASSANQPVALWMPAAGGMLFGSLAPWAKSSATWTPPPSTLVGPGWLRVVTDGVAGPGHYVALSQAPSGVGCLVGSQCQSGHCVDGVCCDTPCDSACVACSAAKKGSGLGDGICGPVAAMTDPDDECAVQSSGTCGTTGVCDGNGKCAVYAAGTTCAPASCSGVILSPPYVCDGQGTCTATPVVNCTPFQCGNSGGGAACTTTCASDAGCALGAFCANGVCNAPQPDGALCTSNGQCESGQCVDGVCCNTDCTWACFSCRAAQKSSGPDGVCGPVAAGQDPRDDCAPEAPSTCGFDGSCNGAGSCNLYPPNTPCGSTTCADGKNGAHSKEGGQLCDGLGTCAVGQGVDCGLFTCSGTICGASCAGATDCIETAFCDGTGVCQSKFALADPCQTGEQCATGYCVDGVCCNTDCTGQCEACDVADKLGVCSPVLGPPHGSKTACVGDDPDCAGSCDGVTPVCTYPGTGVTCGATTCSDGIAHQHYCSGGGTCNADAVGLKCMNFACGADGCKTSCADDGDCSALYRCAAGACVPRGDTKCDGDHTLVGPNNDDLDCTPYRCTSADACLSECASSADCVAGLQCSADGKCVASALPFVPDASCSCGVPGGGGGSDTGVAGAALSAVIAALRRRRRRSAISAERCARPVCGPPRRAR